MILKSLILFSIFVRTFIVQMTLGEKGTRRIVSPAVKFILVKQYNVQVADYLTLQKISSCKYYQMTVRPQKKTKLTNLSLFKSSGKSIGIRFETQRTRTGVGVGNRYPVP
jgi:hypothetical protein